MTGTPYDTGTRLEPSPWVKKAGGVWIAGEENRRRAEPDDFGRVDFDDNEGATILNIRVERSDDGWRVVVDAVQDVEPITVEVVA